jgi:hypothetical protein
MPIKNFKVQLAQTLSNPVVVTIQIDGTTVFNNSITSEATFDLDMPANFLTTTASWSIAVSGGPITIAGILNNYSTIQATVPSPWNPAAVPGNADAYVAALITSQPTFNGEPNTQLYDISSYIVDGVVTGVGSLPIPNNEICVFELTSENYTNANTWNNSTEYTQQDIVIDGGSYYFCILRAPVGTPTSNTTYWAPATLLA